MVLLLASPLHNGTGALTTSNLRKRPRDASSSDHAAFVTSILIMHEREAQRIRRTQNDHHRNIFHPDYNSTILQSALVHDAIPSVLKESLIPCPSSVVVATKVVTPVNISRSTSPVPTSDGVVEETCCTEIATTTAGTTKNDVLAAVSAIVKKSPRGKKNEAKWLSAFDDLKKYKEQHGACAVPRGYTANPKLASWVAEQRKAYKLMKDGKPSSMSLERIRILEDLGFVWNAQHAAWVRHVAALKTFRKHYGHCNVPLNTTNCPTRFPKLGLWVKEQRRHYVLLKQGKKQSHMTEERIAELDALDFVWDTHEATWLERLRELREYKDRHGTCSVPITYEENPKLGSWVHHQRRQYKKYQDGKSCHITEDRIQALERLGLIWFPRADRSSSRNGDDDDSSTTNSVTTSTSVDSSDLGLLDFRPSKRRRTTKQ